MLLSRAPSPRRLPAGRPPKIREPPPTSPKEGSTNSVQPNSSQARSPPPSEGAGGRLSPPFGRGRGWVSGGGSNSRAAQFPLLLFSSPSSFSPRLSIPTTRSPRRSGHGWPPDCRHCAHSGSRGGSARARP